MDLIIFLLIIPIGRALIFFSDWLFMRKVCEQHRTYIQGVDDDTAEDKKKASSKASEWLIENITEIKRRVKKAGISDPIHTFMDAKGFGYVGQEQISVLDNMLLLNKNIIRTAITVLKRTKGYYKNETKKSLNPVYWLEIIFFLPKALVSASGLDASSKIADTGLKIMQIIYWLVIIVAVISNPSLLSVLIENFST